MVSPQRKVDGFSDWFVEDQLHKPQSRLQGHLMLSNLHTSQTCQRSNLHTCQTCQRLPFFECFNLHTGKTCQCFNLHTSQTCQSFNLHTRQTCQPLPFFEPKDLLVLTQRVTRNQTKNRKVKLLKQMIIASFLLCAYALQSMRPEFHLIMGQVNTENLQMVMYTLKVFTYNLQKKETVYKKNKILYRFFVTVVVIYI